MTHKEIIIAAVSLTIAVGVVSILVARDPNNGSTTSDNAVLSQGTLPSPASLRGPSRETDGPASNGHQLSVIESTPSDDRDKFEPATLYFEYLTRAEDGDIDAAFVLVSALSECRNSVKSEQELESEVIWAGYADEVIESARDRLIKCKLLFDEVSDVSAEHGRWYEVIRNADHPLFLVQQQSRPYEETRALVIAALLPDYPEPHLYSRVFMAAARLYIEFPAEGVDETRYYAWQLLACESSLRCAFEEMEEMMLDYLSPIQSDEVLQLRDQLSDALRRRAWSDLGI